MTNNILRNSIIAPYINGLLEEKHANGYSYESSELILNRFDKYCCEYGLKTLEINKDFLSQWMEQKSTEGKFAQNKRISVVRQLMLFMAALGINVYIPHDFCHSTRVLPHIFDTLELKNFFEILDSYTPPANRDNQIRMHFGYRMMFRLYCCCGLRNNEVAALECANTDLEKGIITILNSKGNKDRLIYLSEDLREDLVSYRDYLYMKLKDCKWLFPGMNPEKHVLNTTVDAVFRKFWDKTMYAGCSNKPTVHDFRFTFVVNRMNLWAEEGLDLTVMMPYLSRYLGHKSTNETFYYYFLIKDAYKTIAKKDTIAGYVIPGGEE